MDSLAFAQNDGGVFLIRWILSVCAARTAPGVDSIRSREPSPFGSACGGSIFLVPNEEDSRKTASSVTPLWPIPVYPNMKSERVRASYAGFSMQA